VALLGSRIYLEGTLTSVAKMGLTLKTMLFPLPFCSPTPDDPQDAIVAQNVRIGCFLLSIYF
jgi:hypothetical protein